MTWIHNFSAGPAVLPLSVLEKAQEALVDVRGSGIGILEHSHRGPVFSGIVEEAVASCRRVAGISNDHEILFLQGGASSQFFMLPANCLPEGGSADYLDTGSWAAKAIAEARRYGHVHTAASTKEHGYDRVPEPSAIHYSHAPRYVHFTSNNTIFGTQWREEPDTPEGAYLACDASSDIFSRPIDLDRYGVLYAGAQKNIGPSGTVLVIARKELVAEPVRDLPTMLRYSTYAESGSLYNTPSTFGIYLVGLMFEWILEQGGLRALGKQNEEKALVLYDAIDASGYYRGAAQRESRSLMNVTFTTPSAEDDAAFVEGAEAEGLSGLKGHRSVGGMRASLYNASPRSSVDALVSFMREFERSRG